jgi:hypothetical protein
MDNKGNVGTVNYALSLGKIVYRDASEKFTRSLIYTFEK